MEISDFRLQFLTVLLRRDRRLGAALVDGTILSVQPVLLIVYPEDYVWHRTFVASKVSLVEEVAREILGTSVKLLIDRKT